MPVQAMFDDAFDSDDSEFSEADVSIRRPGHRTHIHQRSASRHRRPEPRVFLEPVQQRVHRSASTGGRRPRERETAPAVMIFNEQGQRSENHSENKPVSRRVQQRFTEQHDHRHNRFEDVEALPVPARRQRAASSVSREHSPIGRDMELVMGQHSIERNDIRQDMDLWKHQMEIERLEREIQRTREKTRNRERGDRAERDNRDQKQIIVNQPDPHESRWMREEADLYEEELAERLRRLQRFERKHQSEEEERKAEERFQLKRFAADRRSAAEEEEVRHKLEEERLKDIARRLDEKNQREKLMREEKWKELARLKEEQEERDKLVREEKWKELARLKEEEEEREKLVREIREEDARQAREAEEKRKKELAMKAAAVEEWKLEQERMKQRMAEEAARKAKEFREHLRQIGYTEEEIDAIIHKKNKDKKKEEKKEGKKEEKEEKPEKKEETKVTWIKVHRKHLLPETLMAYNLPWEWDEHDTNYIIIKKWITEETQEELFGHTRRLREGKVLAEHSHSMTELRVNDRNKDKMFLVRKKSPRGRVRIFA